MIPGKWKYSIHHHLAGNTMVPVSQVSAIPNSASSGCAQMTNTSVNFATVKLLSQLQNIIQRCFCLSAAGIDRLPFGRLSPISNGRLCLSLSFIILVVHIAYIRAFSGCALKCLSVKKLFKGILDPLRGLFDDIILLFKLFFLFSLDFFFRRGYGGQAGIIIT